MFELTETTEGLGLAPKRDCCGKQRRIANGWTRYGPGKVLHRCPECTKAAGVKVLSKLSAG